jgi:hypothetical protein
MAKALGDDAGGDAAAADEGAAGSAADTPPAAVPSAPKEPAVAAAPKATASCNSFVGATAVLMADGSSKPISQVKVGDTVSNAVPDTARVQKHTVTAVHVTRTDRQFDDLTIATKAGRRTITTTQHHLFWDGSLHTWREADNLAVGDELDTPGNGHVRVVANRQYMAARVTYNLTVDTVHTYYVEAGNTSVLVHNCGNSATFVADANGTVVPTSASRLQSGLQSAVDAGEPGFSRFETRSAGVGYELPNGETIRVMQPAGEAPLRASFESSNGQAISPFSGRQVNAPSGFKGAPARQYIRARTHVELQP